MTDSRYTPKLAATILERVSNEETVFGRYASTLAFPNPAFGNGAATTATDSPRSITMPGLCRSTALADEVIVVGYRPDLDPAEKRVICENPRWLLSKMAPTRFGDRLLVAGDPANPIQHLHKTGSLDELTKDQLDALEVFCSRIMLEHNPAGASTQHEVERPTALLGASK